MFKCKTRVVGRSELDKKTTYPTFKDSGRDLSSLTDPELRQAICPLARLVFIQLSTTIKNSCNKWNHKYIHVPGHKEFLQRCNSHFHLLITPQRVMVKLAADLTRENCFRN